MIANSVNSGGQLGFLVNRYSIYETIGDPLRGETLGLSGNISLRGPFRNGYNRIYFRLFRSDGLPFDHDETLNLEFDYAISRFEPRVVESIELKQGAIDAEVSFLLPLHLTEYAYGRVNYRISQSNGRRLAGLSSDEFAYNWLQANEGKVSNVVALLSETVSSGRFQCPARCGAQGSAGYRLLAVHVLHADRKNATRMAGHEQYSVSGRVV